MDKEIKREIILDNYQNPYNKKIPTGNYIKVNTNNESCIDNLDIYFKFNNDVLEDIAFEGEACAISTSATSILIKNIKGKTKEQINEILDNYQKMINEEEYDQKILNELNVYEEIYLQPNRKNCALLPAKAVIKVLTQLKEKM